ncbi:MAG: CBS domain-containing protein [Steroidobacteraceae bacterium]|jgi:magnesium and cobalt transporter|nr:CBS domain-containing protein [Steroidobacteraceae bacterium]
MADDGSSTRTERGGGWLERLRARMSGEPQDREQLLEDMREAASRGLVDADSLEMIEGVLEVSDLHARDIMVPRSQMTVLERDADPESLVPVVVESGHSRFPVIGDDRDEVVGILLAKDLLRYYAEGGPDEGGPRNQKNFDIREVLRPAVFVPESKRLNVLLKEFRKNRHHMAIVVDEYGGVAGLVTIEDVIEQIVGDIADEYDVEEDLPIRREGERQYTVRALTRIEEFNEYFGAEFSDEEFDTVGGLVAHAFGRLPRRGETTRIEDFEFRVLRADRRRIELLRVVAPRDATPPAEAGGD